MFGAWFQILGHWSEIKKQTTVGASVWPYKTSDKSKCYTYSRLIQWQNSWWSKMHYKLLEIFKFPDYLAIDAENWETWWGGGGGQWHRTCFRKTKKLQFLTQNAEKKMQLAKLQLNCNLTCKLLLWTTTILVHYRLDNGWTWKIISISKLVDNYTWNGLRNSGCP